MSTTVIMSVSCIGHVHDILDGKTWRAVADAGWRP